VLEEVQVGEVRQKPVTEPPRRRLSGDDNARNAESPITDELIAAAKRGDRDAWELLYHVHAKPLFGFLMMRLSHADDAAEALSETFLRGIERFGSFRGGPESVKAWFFTVARNVSIDRLRARKRVFMQSEIADTIDLTNPEFDERMIALQDRTDLGLALATLPADDREVLWLRIGQGLSSADVARIVGKRPGAVRMQQMRALQALGEAFPR
jgi:RNA polymerase sigma-70 factor (ECF subfamily)